MTPGLGRLDRRWGFMIKNRRVDTFRDGFGISQPTEHSEFENYFTSVAQNRGNVNDPDLSGHEAALSTPMLLRKASADDQVSKIGR